jgi:glycosyltransferase involved in cell wall biosynthesis
MKVLIVNNMAPFIWGGAEELAVNLQKSLLIAGHQSEILRIPFQWEPATRIPSQMLMVRAFELKNVDAVIALKFPAYLIRHPKKTLWILHQYRQAYDLYDVSQTNLPPGAAGLHIRSLIKNADEESFAESRNIFVNSEVTRQRLMKYNGIHSKVLLPPVNDPELFTGRAGGDYIFAGGRINGAKRQYLLLEALSLTSERVKLVVAGPPDGPADFSRLNEAVERLGLSGRVLLDLNFLPRERYSEYVNHSLAVAYIPYDEDSLGYVSMEAATAGKALITTTDSGGILGLAKNGETGWVAQPTPAELAEVMEAAYENADRTRVYGQNARMLLESMNINWQGTIEALIQ